MGAYILRRLLLMIPTLFGIMLINFALMQFVPGGPIEQVLARLEGEGDVLQSDRRADADRRGRDRGAGGGRRAISARAACRPSSSRSSKSSSASTSRRWSGSSTCCRNYLRFDFGESYFRSISVVDLVIEKMPVSISLGLWSTLLAYLISIPLGHPQGGARRLAVRHLDQRRRSSSAMRSPASCSPILLLVLFAGGSYWQIFPLRGLTSDNWEELSPDRQDRRLPLAHHAAGDRLDHRRPSRR